MDRKAREHKAALVRKAINAMRVELKTASGQHRADLFHDMGLAMSDYDALMDDDSWDDMGQYMGPGCGEAMGEPSVPASPLDEAMDDDLSQDMTHRIGELVPEELGGHYCGDQFMSDRAIAAMDEGKDEGETSQPNDNTTAPGGDVPMGAMAEHSNVYANEWEQINRRHISYILDKTADITEAIEDYEHRALVAGKTSGSKTARNHVAAVMKGLAQVVNASDLTKRETGNALDRVGVKAMVLHKRLGLSS